MIVVSKRVLVVVLRKGFASPASPPVDGIFEGGIFGSVPHPSSPMSIVVVRVLVLVVWTVSISKRVVVVVDGLECERVIDSLEVDVEPDS
jgi:hypothetical protein